MDLSDLKLRWTTHKRVETRLGERFLSTAPLTTEFEAAWRSSPEKYKVQGISISGDPSTGGFHVCWWQDIPEFEKKARAEALHASRLMDTQVDVARPPGLEYLPFQKAGIAYAASRRATLLADEMGLGKTIQAIGTISEINERAGRILIRTVLVVCPSSLKINWRRELHKWLTRPYHVAIGDGAPPQSLAEIMQMPDEEHGSVLILNYAIAPRWGDILRTQTWDLLIADEAHAMKNPKAQRTQAILGTASAKKSEDILSPVPATRKIFISGTPILNKPVEIWPLLQALAPETWKDFFPFALRYCDAHKAPAGRDKEVWGRIQGVSP